jgi:hypothetical protein
MLGYDWPRLHAALNDLPAALLLAAVLFDLAGAITKRPTLRTVGFWTMVLGAVGAAAAVLSGLQAEEHIAHGEAVHRVMETHEELGLITLGIFAVLALWRIVRENRMGSGRPVRHGDIRRPAGLRARGRDSDRGAAGRDARARRRAPSPRRGRRAGAGRAR